MMMSILELIVMNMCVCFTSIPLSSPPPSPPPIPAYNSPTVFMCTVEIGTLISPVWKKPAGTVGGQVVSLDEIEHAKLRDPKVRERHIIARNPTADSSAQSTFKPLYRCKLISSLIISGSFPKRGCRPKGDQPRLRRYVVVRIPLFSLKFAMPILNDMRLFLLFFFVSCSCCFCCCCCCRAIPRTLSCTRASCVPR